jgi:hypothetical protein
MIRTQIYLPQQQHDRLKDFALRQRTSMSDVIRQIVEEKIVTSSQAASTKPKKLNAGEWLLIQAKLAEKLDFRGPSDLASKVDEYLYG